MPKSFIDDNGVEVKRCSKCKQVKPVSEFYEDRQQSDGHVYSCKACQKVHDAAYNKEYYKEHREETRARQKEYRQTAEGKAVCHKAESKHRARKRGATVGPVDVAAVYELSGHACIYCGATKDLTLDHIVPLSRGGPHCQENLVVACRSCNSSKGDKPLVQWLQTQPTAVAWVV